MRNFFGFPRILSIRPVSQLHQYYISFRPSSAIFFVSFRARDYLFTIAALYSTVSTFSSSLISTFRHEFFALNLDDKLTHAN